MWQNRYSNDRWFLTRNINPPYDGEYIVTCKHAKRATVLTYEEGKWYNDAREEFNVVAWMFLPGAYIARPE